MESWYAYEGIYGGHRSFRFYCGLFLCCAQFFFGLSISFVSVLALEGVPGFLYCCSSGRLCCLHFFLDSNGQFTARAISITLSYEEALVLLRPRGDGGSTVVTGAPPGSLSARCVVFTVSPCLIIISPLFPVF